MASCNVHLCDKVPLELLSCNLFDWAHGLTVEKKKLAVNRHASRYRVSECSEKARGHKAALCNHPKFSRSKALKAGHQKRQVEEA